MRVTLELNTGHKFIGKSFGRQPKDNEYGEIVFQMVWWDTQNPLQIHRI